MCHCVGDRSAVSTSTVWHCGGVGLAREFEDCIRRAVGNGNGDTRSWLLGVGLAWGVFFCLLFRFLLIWYGICGAC